MATLLPPAPIKQQPEETAEALALASAAPDKKPAQDKAPASQVVDKAKGGKKKRVVTQQLLVPGPQTAEAWTLYRITSEGKVLEKKEVENPLDVSLEPNAVLGIPVREHYCQSLWLASADETLVPDLIYTALERRGLAARTLEQTVFEYRIIARDEERALAFVAVLPNQPAAAILHEEATYFELSARLLPLEPDRMTLWREAGRWSVAFTRGPELVYTQSLSETVLVEDSARELLCAYLALVSENVLGDLAGIVVYDDITDAELARLQEIFHVAPRRLPRPAPRLPDPLWNLTPMAVQAAQSSVSRSAQTRNGLMALAVIFALMLVAWAGQVGYFSWQAYQLRQEVAKDAVEVLSLKETYARWNAMEQAINPDLYPAELLWSCYQCMPTNGLFITLFQYEKETLTLAGESPSASPAFEFKDRLSAHAKLSEYQWTMPQPKVLPNGVAQFKPLEGVRQSAPAY